MRALAVAGIAFALLSYLGWLTDHRTDWTVVALVASLIGTVAAFATRPFERGRPFSTALLFANTLLAIAGGTALALELTTTG